MQLRLTLNLSTEEVQFWGTLLKYFHFLFLYTSTQHIYLIWTLVTSYFANLRFFGFDTDQVDCNAGMIWNNKR